MKTCPECGSVWTLEEIEDQECGACGWPNSQETKDRLDSIVHTFNHPNRSQLDLIKTK